jgi:iron(III) transport system substrate-binding protein
MKNMKTVLLLVIATMFFPNIANTKSLNIYSHRQPYLLKPFIDAYTKKTGVQLNVVYSSKGLAQRLVAEGANSPADLILTVDIARLHRYEDLDLLANIDSKILNEKIPSYLRSKNNTWFGLSKRTRAIAISRDRMNPSDVLRYEDLADPKLKGKICSRPGSHVYNRALMASIIAAKGLQDAEKWAKGLVSNLAKRPQGNDRSQLKSIYSGECDVAIINHYYYGKLTYSKNPDHRRWSKASIIIFPNQGIGDRGAHVNISGGGVVKYSKNKKLATQFLEFLVTEKAQTLYGDINFEYPINNEFKLPNKLKALGTFREDNLLIEDIAKLAPKAQEIIDTVYW